jgi:Integrase core domain
LPTSIELQYQSYDYTQTLEDHGVLASVGTVGDAYDNALAESFVDTFKTEPITDRDRRTQTQLEQAIVEYIGWYNHDRLHEALGDRRPPSMNSTLLPDPARLADNPYPTHETKPPSHPGRLTDRAPRSTRRAHLRIPASRRLARIRIKTPFRLRPRPRDRPPASNAIVFIRQAHAGTGPRERPYRIAGSLLVLGTLLVVIAAAWARTSRRQLIASGVFFMLGVAQLLLAGTGTGTGAAFGGLHVLNAFIPNGESFRHSRLVAVCPA